jgi:hypothetical protein
MLHSIQCGTGALKPTATMAPDSTGLQPNYCGPCASKPISLEHRSTCPTVVTAVLIVSQSCPSMVSYNCLCSTSTVPLLSYNSPVPVLCSTTCVPQFSHSCPTLLLFACSLFCCSVFSYIIEYQYVTLSACSTTPVLVHNLIILS